MVLKWVLSPRAPVWNEINSSTELASAPLSDWLKRYHQRVPFGLNAHLGRKVRWCRSSPKRTFENEWVQNLSKWSILPKWRSLVPFSFLIVTWISVWGSSVSKYVVQLNSRWAEALRDCCWIQQSSENSADSNSLVDSAEALGSRAPEDPDSVRFILSLKPTNINSDSSPPSTAIALCVRWHAAPCRLHHLQQSLNPRACACEKVF